MEGFLLFKHNPDPIFKPKKRSTNLFVFYTEEEHRAILVLLRKVVTVKLSLV